MIKQTYQMLEETVYRTELESGLTVIVVPRPCFRKKLAYLVTDAGSIHTAFTLDGKACHAPAGVAHYLEHKLFDMPQGDISEAFAAMGANLNAFTSYDMTAYYFSCTDHFPECLSRLLEFVLTPYFTEESVQKEQGIIGQEIDMTADSPENRVFEELMEAMYSCHPIRKPILGDRDSIAAITPQVLYDCHRALYHPSRMILCVVGDVDPAQVCRLASAIPATEAPPSRVSQWDEPMTCPGSYTCRTMEVAMPMFQLGFKSEPIGTGQEAIRREIVGDLAAEALFGESSPLYLRLYEAGLIDSSFGGGFETVEGAALLTASGDSRDPEAVRDAILEEAARLAREGIAQGDFQRMKRSSLGRRIRDLDSFDSTCFRLCAYQASGFDYFQFPQIYRTIEARQIREFIARVVQPQRCCLSVIQPKEKEESYASE